MVIGSLDSLELSKLQTNELWDIKDGLSLWFSIEIDSLLVKTDALTAKNLIYDLCDNDLKFLPIIWIA